MNNKKQPGAIPVLIILILGIWLAIPDEISIAYIVIDFVAKSLCPNPNISFCSQIIIWKILLNILGVVVIIGDVVYIYKQLKKGEIF